MDGRAARCDGPVSARLVVDGVSLVVPFLVCRSMVNNFDCVLGMDVLGLLGGVSVDVTGHVTFGSTSLPPIAAAAALLPASVLGPSSSVVLDASSCASVAVSVPGAGCVPVAPLSSSVVLEALWNVSVPGAGCVPVAPSSVATEASLVASVSGADRSPVTPSLVVPESSPRAADFVAVAVSSALLEARPMISISDDDFSASFDGDRWTVEWTWQNEAALSSLHSQLAQYPISSPDVREAFDRELDEWIASGWLVPHDLQQHGAVDNIIPLMAVVQTNKAKVRPVMDFRQLNEFIPSHTGNSDVCCDTLRKWRRLGADVSLLDLRKAYLQLHVSPHLFRHQAVRIRGRVYCLTRLAFGMNVAPKIMSAVLAKVLSLDDDIARATDNYIDDIIVDQRIVSADVVRSHLCRFGLVTKDPEPLDGARVLGLRVASRGGRLEWSRDNVLPCLAEGETLTRRQLYSLTGRLVGHYPVAGWLRVACSYLKRQCNETPWDAAVCPDVQATFDQLVQRVAADDPVRGMWCVSAPTSRGIVWCDASSLALGACLELNGDIVEDAAWLRKDDAMHINVAELEAVVKGINLALKWGVADLVVKTDSATVHSWLTASLTNSHRVQTKGLAEMLVRRRLSLVTGLVAEYGLTMRVDLVRSASNRADVLTRVPKEWLQRFRSVGAVCNVIADAGPAPSSAQLKELHDVHHLGVTRSLFLARKKFPGVSRREIATIVNTCSECQRIDPAPVVWHRGSLDVPDVWGRLAIDVTHYQGRQYLSIIDCGPSRFAIWRSLPNESAPIVAEQLDSVFAERGPPAECLFDNGKSFRSLCVARLLERWGVRRRFRCAYRPQGNGIVERNHRTIKRMAARTRRSIREMVFWYNHTPHHGTDTSASLVFSYTPALPGLEPAVEYETGAPTSRYAVGDFVFVKPMADARCTTAWPRGLVTAVNSTTQLEVDGVPRHVADVRLVPSLDGFLPANADVGRDDLPIDIDPVMAVPDDLVDQAVGGRPVRIRRPPAYLADFEMDI